MEQAAKHGKEQSISASKCKIIQATGTVGDKVKKNPAKD
jgi:hypothetical protein